MNGSMVFAMLRQCAPHLIHDSLRQSEPTTQTASRSVQPFFAQLTAECPYTLQWDAPSTLLWPMVYLFPKFRENPPITFRVMLFTDRQTNKQTNDSQNITIVSLQRRL